jgi:hypothetical protein
VPNDAACRAVAARFPNLAYNVSLSPNSTVGLTAQMFWRICATAAFVALVGRWSAVNFTLEWAEGAGVVPRVFYAVYWVSACRVGSAEPGGPCSYQEYWTGDLYTGAVSGPWTQQSPVVCACPAQTAPPAVSSFLDSPFASWPGPAIALAGAAVVVLRARRASRPPNPSAPSASEAPGSGRA